jgi:hypothetical protein
MLASLMAMLVPAHVLQPVTSPAVFVKVLGLGSGLVILNCECLGGSAGGPARPCSMKNGCAVYDTPTYPLAAGCTGHLRCPPGCKPGHQQHVC